LPTMGCEAAPNAGISVHQAYRVLRFCCRSPADREQAALLRALPRSKSFAGKPRSNTIRARRSADSARRASWRFTSAVGLHGASLRPVRRHGASFLPEVRNDAPLLPGGRRSPACRRWAAKRPQMLASRYIRHTVFSGFTAGSRQIASKLRSYGLCPEAKASRASLAPTRFVRAAVPILPVGRHGASLLP
jgi:hypothetical protein